ncbi:hypothetical protein ACH5RR_016351 [Cinchona calisaya]|uniref:Uncharacterized protein n=1 Tax=Cinchona calisaya TaxID=153742 RepID=A0ABD2ZZD3_9GENT
MGSRKNNNSSSYDYSFKILLIGDSGVGKSSLVLSFISQQYLQDLSPTIGVDFKMKLLTFGGKRMKLTIWDTAGQERFGSLTSSYYRGAHGIILVYDVTRRETFTNLSEIWAKEVEIYSTNHDCIRILVGNKVDRDSERAVTVEEGIALAREHKCLFFECSARTRANVQQCFKELISKIVEVPSLLDKGSAIVKKQVLEKKQMCRAENSMVSALLDGTNSTDIYKEWVVSLDSTFNPVSSPQPVITINGQFPGPLINATTNDFVHVNLFNNLDESLLFTWNGIQQRLNSWQDGVSGTNCPIQPGKNWTYVFETKDQIGTFTYFPSINFQKVAGGFGPIQVNNRVVIAVPFATPEAEFDLLIGDWFSADYRVVRSSIQGKFMSYGAVPDVILMNGKGPYGLPNSKEHESFTVTKGKTYRFRISNVGTFFSFNFRIQSHLMVLVETEGSYTNQITLDSLDVHVGQSYSVLVTAIQDESDYYMVATPKLLNTSDSSPLVAKGVLHYANYVGTVSGPLPSEPNPYDIDFSVDQAKSIRWNLTAGAARPNPQGTFNVTNITLSKTFILHGSISEIDGLSRYTVNNVSYFTPNTPLKLADQFVNGSVVYQLDAFPVDSINDAATYGVSVVTGVHKGWLEIVFKNDLYVMDSWHLDGFGFYVVGFGDGDWTPESRTSYNLYDPVVRSTVQVYPQRWTAVYVFLDNPGMWNLRSQHSVNWYLGQELYIRVHDPDPNPAKEKPPPQKRMFDDQSNAPIASPFAQPSPLLPDSPAPQVAISPPFPQPIAPSNAPIASPIAQPSPLLPESPAPQVAISPPFPQPIAPSNAPIASPIAQPSPLLPGSPAPQVAVLPPFPQPIAPSPQSGW